MQLLSVNVGQRQRIAAKSGWSGIYKEPVPGPVRVGEFGLAGDHIADTRNHGGLTQAAYVYTRPDYAAWEAALGRPLVPGTFGENLLFSDLESAPVQIGQQFRIGEVVLEVTDPRIPCVTLAARMEDPGFVQKFRQMERPGFYCRVLVEGEVEAGQEVVLLPPPAEYAPTILRQFRTFFG